MSDKQSQYINAIYEGPVVVCTGYAGTGKTYVAARLAASLYAEKQIDRIILTRPNVSAGKSLGFFPGDLADKTEPWMRPLVSRLKADLGGAYDSGVRKGNIKVEPFETMRGASYDGFVILDEAQNTTPEEMKMFLTRYEGGRVIINGDVRQSDLKTKSGLSVLVDMIGRGDLPFHHIDFSDLDDIVRSDVCRDVILAWDRYENA
jgi:phosphate starvation-inducible PhoH-like protein